MRLKLGVLDYINFKDFSNKRHHRNVQTDSQRIQCLKLTKDRHLNSGMFKKRLQIKILEEKKIKTKSSKAFGDQKKSNGQLMQR